MTILTEPLITTDTLPSVDQDFSALREEALEHLRTLSGQVWTDHNTHDVGITTADAFCFALTEQGHLNGLPIKELLQRYGDDDALVKDFFQAGKVLHNAPVTLLDWRKFLIDRESIRNAWMIPITGGTPPHIYIKDGQYNLAEGLQINLLGLYDVLLEWSADPVLGELNGNIITTSVTITLATGIEKTYWADLIFPFTWDTDDTAFIPFRQDLTITSVTPTSANPLHPQLDPQPGESNVYFSELQIQYDPAETVSVGVILRINAQITSDLERQSVENRFITLLSDVNGPVSKYNDVIVKGYALSRSVMTLLMERRNLSEDIVRLKATNIQEIGIQAEVEVVPGAAIEDLLAEMFFALDSFISPEFNSYDYDQALEDVLDGPALDNGALNDAELSRTPSRSIFLSDLLHLMLEGEDGLRNEKIIAVYGLAIQSYIHNKAAGKSEVNCLRLVDDATFRPRLSIFKSQVIVRERGVRIPYDPARVFEAFRNLKNTAPAVPALLPEVSLQSGPEKLSSELYRPIQYEFPAFYHLAIDQVTPINAHMRGYMFFFEQMMANLSSLRSHATQLLSVSNLQPETRYPANIRKLLPFYDRYLAPSYESILPTSDSENTARRSLILDHLLARMGEDFRYYGAWNNLSGNDLNDAKHDFLMAFPGLAEERFSAYNHTVVAWNTSNISIAEKKLVHLLQLPGDVRKTRWRNPAPNFSVLTTPGPNVLFGFRISDAGNAPLLRSPQDTFEFEFEAEDAATSVIQWGRSVENYEIIEDSGQFRFALLDIEKNILAVSEGLFATLALARAAIDTTTAFFKTWLPEEGMHLVENILLRPQVYANAALVDALLTIPLLPDNSIAPGFGKDMYSHQVLVVLPGAGDRFGDAAFQEVASAVIRKELPAWLRVRVVWLNLFMMSEFELAYEQWVKTMSNNLASESDLRGAKEGMIQSLNSIHDWLVKKA